MISPKVCHIIVFLWLVLRGIRINEGTQLNLFYATTKVPGLHRFYHVCRVRKRRAAALVSVHSLVRGLTLLQRSSLPLMLILLAYNVVEINPGSVCSQHSSLNCIGMNARSLKSLHTMNGQQTFNLSRFQDLVYTENADLVLVTDTWLLKDIHDGEILHNEVRNL